MMGKRILKSKINYLVISIMITASGTVFFFPLNIDGKYTCFYHRIFDHSHPVSNEANLEHRHIHSEDLNQTENKNSTPNDKKNNDDSRNKVIGTHYRSVLLENYLHQYAFVWWLSVGLLALSIFMWLKLKKQDRKYKSGIVTQ
jgi:hypothetical protein